MRCAKRPRTIRAQIAAGALLALSISPCRASNVLYENSVVRVLRAAYPPFVRSSTHSHPSGRLVYVLSGGRLRIHSPDGKITETALDTGGASWRPPESHALENPGPVEVSVIEMEIKEADEKAVSPEDASDLGSPEDFPTVAGRRIAFRNRWGSVVVHRVESAGTIDPAPIGADRFFYWISSAELRGRGDDGFDRITLNAAGSFQWFPAGRARSRVNAGARPIEAVEFVLDKPQRPRRKMTIRFPRSGETRP